MKAQAESWLKRHGETVYRVYSPLLLLAALSLLWLNWDSLIWALSVFSTFQIFLLLVLCPGILLLGFPSSRLGYASFDRITQAGLIWLVGPAGSALFNGFASLIFPFYIRANTGQTVTQALFRAMHNVGMIITVIMAGGWAFQLMGGSYPVRAIELGTIVPVVATIMAMQVVNGAFVRLRVALTDARIGVPVDWFANTLEPAAALIGLLTVVIAVNTDQVTTLSYLFVLLALMLTVKRLSDSRMKLEEKVAERTARVEAQKKHLEQAQEKQQELVAALERLSREDSLTGLYNRRHADEFLRQEHDRMQRYGGELSISLLDLDRFKRINDCYSHQVGDDVLKATAELLCHHARSSDMVARYGGEEFLIVLPNTGLEGAKIVMERIRIAMGESDWCEVHPGLAITISAGVAQLRESEGIDQLLSRADANLYQAKDEGRDQVVAS